MLFMNPTTGSESSWRQSICGWSYRCKPRVIIHSSTCTLAAPDKPIKIYSLEGRQPAPTSGPSAPCAFTCGVPSPLSSSKSFSMSGAMFDQDSRVIQSAFLHAIQHYSQNTAGRRLQLHAFVGIISMADAFKISRLTYILSISETF
ncbi:uncharacterized protein LOC135098951 [Scylla paramamosain]|uniref:uncharacterized protein LOC135098951 n=1 Tax=Scylla paramamosain TaxID=85552 RepID=UPI003083E98B